jgi:hypothetical protein
MTTAPVHAPPAPVGRPRSAFGGRLGRAVATAAVLVSAVGGLSVAGAPPAAAAPQSWGGSFDGHAHHVTVTPVSSTSSRIVTRVLQCGQTDPCGPADRPGTLVGRRTENVTTFTYSAAGQQHTISVNRNQRDLPIAYSFPVTEDRSTSGRQVRTLRGDAYHRWTNEAGAQFVDVRTRVSGEWRWLRFTMARINENVDGAVFQYNQMISAINRTEAAEVAVTGFGVLGATGEMILAASGKLSPVAGVFAVCGIAVAMCVAARQRYTSSDAAFDAAVWLYSHGYGYRPNQTEDD